MVRRCLGTRDIRLGSKPRSSIPAALHGADEDLARRAELERRLVELSDKEFDLMVELRRLQQVEH